MSYDEPIETIENDVLTVGVGAYDGGYILWQRGLTAETNADDGVYFEYDDQIPGLSRKSTCRATHKGCRPYHRLTWAGRTCVGKTSLLRMKSFPCNIALCHI